MLSLRLSAPEDLPAILTCARGVGVFSDEEVATVEELFEGYLKDPVKSGYNFISCYAAESLVGFACWGPTALSKGAADLYWICAAREVQKQGVASALLRAVEEAARSAGRWLIVIWTSNRPEYAPARNFYQRQGCELKIQLTDFYDRGEDLCVFVKNI